MLSDEVHILIGIIVITYLMFVYKEHFEKFNIHVLLVIIGIFLYEKSDDLQKGFKQISKLRTKKETRIEEDTSLFLDRLKILSNKSPKCIKIIDTLRINLSKFNMYHEKLMNSKRLSIRKLNNLATRLRFMEHLINELYLNSNVDAHRLLHDLNNEYEMMINKKYDELYDTHYSYKQAIKISLMNI